jgi:glycosyltransferase involved in cell wall biosynthesis
MLITDGPTSGSGFGEEMKNVAFRLVQSGRFKVTWYSLQHTGYPVEMIDGQFDDLPNKGARIRLVGHRPTTDAKMQFGAEMFPKHWAAYNPDFVLFMGDPKNIYPYVMPLESSLKKKLGFPLYMYVTLDGLPIHPNWLIPLSQVNVLIAMTEWAQLEYMRVKEVELSPAFIHHGINWNWWSNNPKLKAAMRRKYRIPQKYKLYICWDVNQHRKRIDALLRCWKAAKPEKKNMKLLLYTDWHMENKLGWDIEGLIHQLKVPRETILSPLQVQKTPKFWECPESPSKLLEIARMGDIYPTATSGEGFGKCGPEANALGMPVIIPSYSACPEVCAKGSILVPIIGTYRMDDRRRSVGAGIVDEEKFTAAIEELYYNEKKLKELSLEAREWSRKYDYDTRIVPQWVNLLESINPDAIMMKELLQL